jgi:PAS domain S-box-containing protein
MQILFVDDNPDDVMLAVRALRDEGLAFRERIVSTGNEVAAALREGSWTAVISDYNLVGETGLDILRIVRERDADVPFILLSGTIGEERAAEAIRKGAQDYVMKDRMMRLGAALRREIDAAGTRITQRRLEARLRRFEERYRRTCEEAPIGIANFDGSGMILSINHRFCTLLGYEAAEMVGRPIMYFIHPEEVDGAVAMFGELCSGRRSDIEVERRYVRKDGTLMWASLRLSALRDADGVLDYIISLVEDITARKESREKLLLQSRLLECVEQAVIATDAEGRVTFWNRFAETMYGWRAEEAIGRRIVELTPAAETMEEANAILGNLLRNGESWSGEIVMQRRDGSTFPAWVIDAPLLDERGRFVGVVGVSHDRTEQKRAENDLREHKLQLDMAQSIAATGSWTLDVATGIRHWSDGICRMYGITPTATLDEAMRVIHAEDREHLLEMQRRAQQTLEPVETEFRINHPDGSVRTLSTRFAYITDADGKCRRGIGVVQDVTAAKEAEQELRRRALQQSTVANLGQIALSGSSLRFLFEQVVAAIGDVMGFEVRGILRVHETGVEVVEGFGYTEGNGAILDLGDDSQTMYTIRHGVPVVVTDVADETRFTPAPYFVEQGYTSGITVPIHSADGAPWGVILGYALERRTFAPHDVDFFRAVASIIGQAIDRAAADTEVRTRARQQSAIAELGRLILTSVDGDVFQQACDLLAYGASAEFAFYLEITPGETLRRVAGELWTPDLPHEISIAANAQAGYTILSGKAVVVDDYRTEDRFDTRAATVPYGILSGAMVPVAGAKRVFGVLSAQSREAGHFRESDVDFLHSLANMLAEAMERELARDAIEESHQRYRRIFEGSTEIIFTLDTEGRFLALSSAFETITGSPREEWLGRRHYDLVAPEDRANVASVFGKMVADGQPATAQVKLLGSTRQPIVDVSSFAKIDNGVVTEIYGFARDVTEARRAEHERERLTRSLQLLLESTVEGIVTVDLYGRCTMVNRAAAAFLGHAPEDLLGASVHEWSASLSGALHDGEPRTSHDDTFRRGDGALIPVAYSAAPIVDAGERVGAVITFTDLTDRRKLEARLEQANRLSSLGRLAATVAHEFNNVLMGISPFVEVVRRTTDPAKVASSLEYIANSVKRGRRVTQDILRFTQPAEPVRTAVDLHVWLQSVATEAVSVLTPQYTIDVDAEPLAVDADPNQLHQIFMNLILNARDAMPRGGMIAITARSERADARFAFGHVDDPSRYAHISVVDMGVGMSEETLRHAFEPLFTTKKSGTGLGLAVTHQVVQRHGGEIFIESAEGWGTTFHIFLPLIQCEVVEMPQAAGEMPQEHAQRRILLVEDDLSVAAGITTVLELEGFAVEHAETGADALAAVNRARPDAVLLDVGLPDMDGKTVFAGIAERHPTLPVIFSTGHADRGELEDALAHPHVSCLLKPYDTDTLLSALDEAMGASRMV